MGHPDKLADQISDGVLDALIAQDPMSRVACETLVTTGLCVLAGEITTKGWVDFQEVARDVIHDVGYLDAKWGIGWDTCSVLVALHSQSPDIAMGVNEDQSKGKEIGAGDQGLMFGYAINDTPELMPLPIALAHRITNALTDARKRGLVNWLRPDSKSQVTVEFDGNRRCGSIRWSSARSTTNTCSKRKFTSSSSSKSSNPACRRIWSMAKSSTTSIRPAGSWSAVRTATPV